MKAIILAAGMGKRLGKDIPKALVEIEEKRTILDLQLENLNKVFDCSDIYVVVGYKANLIEERYGYLNFIYNENYAKTNTSKSLLKGLERVNDDVLWLNGDIVFEAGLLDLLKSGHSNLVFVNNAAVGEEEVKYTVDSDGFIDEISKSVRNALGEAVGINFITNKDRPALRSCLEACDDGDYFERGIERSIDLGIKFLPASIGGKLCIEVDFQEDLSRARSAISQRGDAA